ncbi:MAG: ChbG/HpnK family deacetylase [Planctomycetes bacterium]|nr:ChbG/HpnK family deacetylase [Planctomycetota bacterium]
MKPRVVITSDDFGFCHSVNQATLQAMQDGFISSTNLMVPCPWFCEALEMVQQYNLSSGIHLTITCEWDRMRWGSLTGQRELETSLGHLYPTYDAVFKHASVLAIEKEYRAQIEAVLATGFKPSHLDTHMTAPMLETDAGYGEWLAMVVALSEEYQLPYAYACENGATKYFADFMSISDKDEDVVKQYIDSMLDDKVYNITCHLAADSDELRQMAKEGTATYPWAVDYRLRDLQRICGGFISQELARRGIEIVGVEEAFAAC